MPLRKRMQDVNFRSVADVLDYLPEDQRDLMDVLREIVLGTIPNVTERLAFNVPFYRRHANLCFLWPGAVPWGKSVQAGVRLGFANGYLLLDESGYLDQGNRKQVYWKDYRSIQEIDDALITSLLLQAVEIDERLHAEKLLKAAARRKSKR